MLYAGSFPFNSFLAGFFCHLGLFVFAGNLAAVKLYLSPLSYFVQPLKLASLRLAILPDKDGKTIESSTETAFAGFSVCCLTLFFVVFSYLG